MLDVIAFLETQNHMRKQFEFSPEVVEAQPAALANPKNLSVVRGGLAALLRWTADRVEPARPKALSAGC